MSEITLLLSIQLLQSVEEYHQEESPLTFPPFRNVSLIVVNLLINQLCGDPCEKDISQHLFSTLFSLFVIILHQLNKVITRFNHPSTMTDTKSLKIFAGIEGGATRSTTVLVREDGKILCWVDGITTNYLLVGLEQCQETIKGMIDAAKVKASVDDSMNWMLSPEWSGLDGIGMGLSGCEDEQANEHFVNKLLERYPKLAKKGWAVSDTIGSIYSACPSGGIVLISGTGSNSLLLNPDGSSERCGGWGHMLGDEGSSWWIAHRAIKWVISTEEGFDPSPYPVEKAKEAIFKHLEISDLFGLLPHFHTKFIKSHIAGIAAKLAHLANEGDAFSLSIFYEAGAYLAKHILGLLPRASQKLLQQEGGIRVVCVGSVWKSWHLLREGFFAGLKGKVSEMTLVKLKQSSAIGCAYLAAKRAGVNLPIDFGQNYEVFCHFKVEDRSAPFRKISTFGNIHINHE